jgi:hypothetical protein
VCCSLAELTAKESQPHQRKAKKRSGRSCIGDSSGGIPIIIKGYINRDAIRDIREETDIRKAISYGASTVGLAADRKVIGIARKESDQVTRRTSSFRLPHSAKKLVPSAKNREDVFTAQLSGVVFMTVIPVADPSKVTERLEDEFSVNTS